MGSSPHGEGESFAVPLKIHATRFAGTKKRPLPPLRERPLGLWDGKFYFAAIVDAGMGAGREVGRNVFQSLIQIWVGVASWA